MVIAKKQNKNTEEGLSTFRYRAYFKAFFGQFASLYFGALIRERHRVRKHEKRAKMKSRREARPTVCRGLKSAGSAVTTARYQSDKGDAQLAVGSLEG